MLIINTDFVTGKEIVEVLGGVQGNTVRTKHIGRDMGASLKSIVGGELRGYTDMMTEARNEAIERMSGEASQMGADAVINVRFSTANLMGGAAEFLAYGTAVTLSPQ